MKRARIDDVKDAIKDLPVDKQKNVMLIAKTHGVTTRFIDNIKDPEYARKNSVDSWIQKYIDELKEK
ncbi:hypothetical protein [uncultured Clostridium sp.]|uniref:hypothetical protein n=1 Tax=uncultured Clostridium sp. TaxID=59620 RepID=UPI0025CD050D|nr:hypothetical protein [uncultured Clostridium sp.]